MKRILVFIFCILFAVSVYAAVDQIAGQDISGLDQIAGQTISGLDQVAGQDLTVAPTCDITNIVFWWRAEADDFTATNGTLDYSTGSPVGTLESAAAINTDAVKYGTNGLDCPTGGDDIRFATPNISLDDEGRIGFWVRITTFYSGNSLFRVHRSDANDNFNLIMSGTDELSFIWKDSGTVRTALVTSGALIGTGTWYFIEAAWKVSTNYREVFVNGISKGSSSETIDSFSGDVIYLYVGEYIAAGASDIHIDNVIISTDSTQDLYTVCKDETEYPG